MDASLNGYTKQNNVITEWVWFEGATALKEGQGVCYNFDYGVAADADGQRGNRVELPVAANARFFAGVAARDYSAKPGGQLIEIYKPGSVCNILAHVACVIGTGTVTCTYLASSEGYFIAGTTGGEGSAIPLQTVDRSTTVGKVLAKLEVGPPTGLVSGA